LTPIAVALNRRKLGNQGANLMSLDLKLAVLTFNNRRYNNRRLLDPKLAVPIHRRRFRTPLFPCRYPEQIQLRHNHGSQRGNASHNLSSEAVEVRLIPAHPANAARKVASNKIVRSSRRHGNRLQVHSGISRGAGGGNETARTNQQSEI